jgi:hypothetical protein
MQTRIAFVNGKGGVGKTTCTTLLAAALKSAGQDVSIEDRDPQKSATTAAGTFELPVGAGGWSLSSTPPPISSCPRPSMPSARGSGRARYHAQPS